MNHANNELRHTHVRIDVIVEIGLLRFPMVWVPELSHGIPNIRGEGQLSSPYRDWVKVYLVCGNICRGSKRIFLRLKESKSIRY